MKPCLVDVHTHTQFAAYESDRDVVIRRTLDAGIWLINVGTQRDTSTHSCELAHRYDGVFATVGLHPIHTEKSYHDAQELGTSDKAKGFTSRGEDLDYNFYKKIAEDSKVVAIGECGLDYYRLTEETKVKQAEIFIKQIELAHEVKKPLMIHCRDAFADLIDILTSNRQLLNSIPGICHFFTGTIEDAKQLMDLGFSFSFGGVITFAREYEKLIKFIPLERILLETDAPYVAPQAHRGKRNEPLYIEEVAQKIAKIRGISFEEVSRVTTKNAIKIFGLK